MNISRKQWKRIAFFVLVSLELVILFFIGQRYLRRFFSFNPLDSRVTKEHSTSAYTYFYENERNIVKTDKMDWMEEAVEYRHNGDGLNNIRDYPLEKKKNVFRIAAVGDSFTYGMYVSTKDNWATSLERKLNLQECGKRAFEVINLGVPGYDINYTIERNKLRGEEYKPDLFIWFIKSDDFSDSKELSAPFEAQILRGKTYTVDLYKQALSLVFKKYDKAKIVSEQTNHLEQYIAENKNTSFLFVLPKGTIGYPSIDKEQEETIKRLKKKYKNVDYTFIELKREHTFFPHDSHFNVAGHQLFSNFLTRVLSGTYCL